MPPSPLSVSKLGKLGAGVWCQYCFRLSPPFLGLTATRVSPTASFCQLSGENLAPGKNLPCDEDDDDGFFWGVGSGISGKRKNVRFTNCHNHISNFKYRLGFERANSAQRKRVWVVEEEEKGWKRDNPPFLPSFLPSFSLRRETNPKDKG